MAQSPLADPRVEIIAGDILDPQSVRRGMTGCSRVFHLAAYAKNWAAKQQTFFDMNVQGVRHVFDAARDLAVERIVWTSTVVTMGPSRRGEIRCEQQPRIIDTYYTDYEQSKAAAEIFATIPAGLYWGMVAFRTQSLLPSLVQHFLLGIVLDWFICYR
jgi:nucleoside-diphosphate-sugar epimerase